MLNNKKEKGRSIKGFIPIQTALDNFVMPIYRRSWFPVYKLATNWDKIIGCKLASISTPSGIYFQNNHQVGKQRANGILMVSIANPGFALALQAAERIIVSKVTNYLGYKIISKIKIRIQDDIATNMSRNTNSTRSKHSTPQIGYTDALTRSKDTINKQQWQELEAALIKINDTEVASSLEELRDVLFEVK